MNTTYRSYGVARKKYSDYFCLQTEITQKQSSGKAMNTDKERTEQLNRDLAANKTICSSAGTISSFPEMMKDTFKVNGIGLILCSRGGFGFTLNQRELTAHAGDTVFIPEDSFFAVTSEEENMQATVLFYQVEPIRSVIGNLVLFMYPYSQQSKEPCYVWSTNEEEDIARYISLIDSTLFVEDNIFTQYEQKLLLLALTHRLCSVYTRKLISKKDNVGHKNEVFIKLIQLIDKYYMQERGVEFYADKLCLSPKYLSAISKSVCGYTVQELVFKAIMCKCISLLTNTQMSIQEIAYEMNFPNASYFGTFFRKQTGMSPMQYRRDYTK